MVVLGVTRAWSSAWRCVAFMPVARVLGGARALVADEDDVCDVTANVAPGDARTQLGASHCLLTLATPT
jgi:hypothetical protein